MPASAPTPAVAQTAPPWFADVAPRPEVVDRSHGLSHNSVFEVVHDHQGFLWIGTIDGLNRYDGASFEVFRHDPGDSTSLSNSTVRRIWEDRQRRLWVRTGTGLDRYDRSTGSFIRYSITAQLLLEDGSGTLWAAARDGLYRYDPAADDYVAQGRWPDSTDSPDSTDVDDASARQIWGLAAGSDGSIWTVRADGGLIRHAPDVGLEAAGRLPWSDTVVLGQEGDRVLIGHAEGAGWFDLIGRDVTAQPPAQAPAEGGAYLAGLRDRAGRSWLGGSGLWRSDRAGAPAERVWPEEAGAPLATVWALAEDRAGNVWAATVRGLLRFDAFQRSFSHTLDLEAWQTPDPPGPIMAIDEVDAGTLWLGTLGSGLYRVSPASGVPERIVGPDEGVPNVWAVLADADGSMWAGTQQGLVRVEPSGAVRRWPSLPGTSGGPVFALAKDTIGRLWIGSADGLSWLDPSTGERGVMERLSVDRAGPTRVESLHELPDGRIVAGTSWSDLYVIEPGSSAAVYVPTGDVPALQGSEGLWAGAVDADGRLWLGSDRGLWMWDEPAEALRPATNADGPLARTVYEIVSTADGDFWMSTGVGLVRVRAPASFPERTLEARSYRIGVDLAETEYNRRAAALTPRGVAVFGGMAGVTYFDPDAIQSSPFAPPVVVDRIERLRGDSVIVTEAYGRTTVRVAHDDAGIDLHFAAPSFGSADGVRYSVMLEGLDPDWYTPREPRVRYLRLPSGRYTFRVRAASPDGVGDPEGASLEIVVPPPFWATPWFRGAGAALALGLLLAVTRHLSTRRLRAQVAALELERSVQRERDRISRDLHDHVGSHVSSLVSGIELAMLSTEAGQPSRARNYLAAVDRDARRTLTELRETVWSLHHDRVTVRRFAERVEEYLERRGRLTSVRLGFESHGPGEAELTPSQALNLFRILQEAVTNAVRHAAPTSVRVRLEVGATSLALAIDDDGTYPENGFNGGTGLGIRGMSDRAEELGGSLTIAANERGGTCVQVRFAYA